MSDSNLIKAPRYGLNEDKKVIDLDANTPVEGIAVFGERPAALPAEESPITAMKRWSEFRQSSATKAK
jgi:hypothetical protein